MPIDSPPPASVLLLGALLVPFLKGPFRAVWLVALPVLSGVQLMEYFSLPSGAYLQFDCFEYTFTLLRIDGLALAFGLIFHIAALLAVIFSLRTRDAVQPVCALLYAGASIAAVFAGDLGTLFVYWELTAIASAFLVWASRTERSYRAGMRYLVLQVGSGVLLLAGMLIHLAGGGSLAFGHLGTGTLGTNLIFAAFAVKCAFPLLHTWLVDAYPEGTPTGTVFLSIFTTKLAIYAMARGFTGFPGLMWAGAVMALFPILFALVENDLRRVLAYSLISQLGFKVAGIGIGTPTAVNGAVAHSFAGILYTSLMFMALGAVMERTGSAKASALGGLRKSMPFTAAFCVVGAASISALPLTGGFVSKSLILAAAAEEHHVWLWLALLVASAGTVLHTGIRVPMLAFFGERRGSEGRMAPGNMLVAMGATAALCVLLGIFPQKLYDLLPYAYAKSPYDATHIVTQLQLVAFAALLWPLLAKPAPGILLDADWLYRRALPAGVAAVVSVWRGVRAAATDAARAVLIGAYRMIYRQAGPHGSLSRTWLTSTSLLWVTVILGALLVLYYL